MNALQFSSWNTENGNKTTAVRRLSLWENTEAFALVTHPEEKIRDTIAEILANAIASTLGEKPEDDYEAFSQVLERANRQIVSLHENIDTHQIGAFVGLFDGTFLHFSVLGEKIHALLVKNGTITDVCRDMHNDGKEFGFISSGKISQSEWLYVSHVPLSEYIASDDLEALTTVTDEEKHHNLLCSLYERAGLTESVETIIIHGHAEELGESIEAIFALAQNKISAFFSSLSAHPLSQKTKLTIQEKLRTLSPRFQAVLFGTGFIVCLVLLYLTVTSILHTQTAISIPEAYKTKLIDARRILDEAGQAVGDKPTATALLSQAEKIVFEVRDKSLYLSETQGILNDISALKKQINGIETAKIGSNNMLWSALDQKIVPVSLVQVSKKPYLVTATEIIGPFITGAQPKRYSLPKDTKAIGATVLPANEKIYVLTEKGGVLEFAKETFTPISPDGGKGWVMSQKITGYDDKLYLLHPEKKQILRYRLTPRGGFSEGVALIDGPSATKKMFSFGINMSIFTLNEDLTIDKISTAPKFIRDSIRINNYPKDDYNIKNDLTPDLFLATDINHFYVLMNGKIWVFGTGVRDPRAITAVKYLGQIEPNAGSVLAFTVPRDGEIILTTAEGVYQIRFDVVSDKIVVRN